MTMDNICNLFRNAENEQMSILAGYFPDFSDYLFGYIINDFLEEQVALIPGLRRNVSHFFSVDNLF